MNSAGAVFDPRLGGKDQHGSKYRNPKTGWFVSSLKVSTCPPHYWLINEKNVGCCKKCGAVRDFGKELKKYLPKSFPYYPQPKEKEYE
jgi:hypothetical protein